jgi:GGDEF domain-containing protein
MISLDRLQELQERIEQAFTIDDVRRLKRELCACLESIRGECGGQTGETKSREETPEFDPLTGLPLRSVAEGAMKAACAGGTRTYACLFVMDRIQVINSRFGNQIADQVLLFFVQGLTMSLMGKDTLYRWSPASFLALFDRLENPDQVRREMARTMSQRQEQTFEIGDR